MHTNQHQKQNISQGREREREKEVDNVKFFGRIQWISPVKIGILGPKGLRHGNTVLSRKILNILYDRHGSNPGFLILRTFENLNSKT